MKIKKLLLILSVSLILCSCGTDISKTVESNLSGTVSVNNTDNICREDDFWVDYEEFAEAMEKGKILTASYSQSFTANPKEIFKDCFIPLEMLVDIQDNISCEVKIYPEYGIYHYSISLENENQKTFLMALTVRNTSIQYEYLDYPDISGSYKCDNLTEDRFLDKKKIHIEGIVNNVPYMLRKISDNKSEDKFSYNLIMIQGDYWYNMYTAPQSEGGNENILLSSQLSDYVSYISSYITKNASSVQHVYEESKSFEEIYNANVKRK